MGRRMQEVGLANKIDVSIFPAISSEGQQLKTRHARRGPASNRHMTRVLLGTTCMLAVGLAIALGASPARAQYPYPSRYPSQIQSRYKHKVVRKHGEETSKVSKLPFGDIPKGPLQIFVSIDQQKLHFYSGGVHVADEPVATGVPGHLTPLGVFNVIQRDRYHHSNIYDNAPMPFMERITWSGVALHEGVGLGHPASHGCIRMPHDFAARLWMLPTMGMGVIIAHPELRPEDISDSHLFAHNDKPASAALPPTTRTAQTTSAGTKTDATDPGAAPHAAEVASASDAKIAMPVPPVTPKAEQVTQASPPSQANPPAVTGAPVSSDPAQPGAAAPGKPTATASSPAAAAAPAPAAPAAAAASPAAPAVTGKDSAAQAPAPAAPTASAPAAPNNSANPAGSADIAAPVEDIPLPLSKPARIAEESGGPLAIFISRKTGKIYVRQNFTPLLDAPITIERPDQPLGTHVFTALDYLSDHSAFHWTVVNLPAERPKAAEHWKTVRDRYGRVRRVRVEEPAVAADLGPPETAQGALARIQIPQDVIDQISRLIVPGSSLTISDQGLGSETGDGTDFIVVTR
jgi:lipoprotein-anchoring transpeptidase ErfK/SrfK